MKRPLVAMSLVLLCSCSEEPLPPDPDLTVGQDGQVVDLESPDLALPDQSLPDQSPPDLLLPDLPPPTCTDKIKNGAETDVD